MAVFGRDIMALLKGEDGSALQIRVSDGYIQWKLETDTEWNDVIAVDELKGADGVTPHIGEDGYWYIGDTSTGVKAQGEDGVTPHIGEDGCWYIGDTSTGVKAQGEDGKEGLSVKTAELSSGVQVPSAAAFDAITVGVTGEINPTNISDFVVGDIIVIPCTISGMTNGNAVMLGEVKSVGSSNITYSVVAAMRSGDDAEAGAQQSSIINRTASIETADEDSPDFVENGGSLWVKTKTKKATMTAIETPAVLPKARWSKATAQTAPNGKIYVFGGGYESKIFEFDPVAQSITELETTLPLYGNGRAASALAQNGKIYLFGGNDTTASRNPCNTILEFDPVAQSITELETTLPTDLSDATAATAPGGKIYIFCGQTLRSGGFSNKIFEFDPVAQTCTEVGTQTKTSRASVAVTAPNGKIYVFGEKEDVFVYEFDPATLTGSYVAVSLPEWCTVEYGEPTGAITRLNDCAATLAQDDEIYLFGGIPTSLDTSDRVLKYDPATKSLVELEEGLPHTTSGATAATAPDGTMYVFGGAVAKDNDSASPIVSFAMGEVTQIKYVKLAYQEE